MATSAVRRRPAQARSQERFDRILGAARELIVERGLEPMTMTAIADRADVALTAVYRYFPNKQSVVRELALQTFAHDTETLVGAGVGSEGSAEELIGAGIAEFWRRHVAEPYRLPLRAAIHADVELSALDLAESRHDARLIAELVASTTGRDDLHALERRALLVVELIDSVVRLLDRVEPDEVEPLLREFTAMATRMLASETVAEDPYDGERSTEVPATGRR